MEILSGITVTVPVKRGDVIVENFLGEGVALVAGKTVE
jgi:CxxC motif-containing protein